jgi:hypothetical protein
MREVWVAHFGLRWQAEFALGFLQDADIVARIVDDGGVGTGPYTGDLMGASLLVPEDCEAEARRTLETAGVLADPALRRPEAPPLLDRPLPPVLRADAQDVTDELAMARKAATRHALFALLGVTPAALLPMIGLLLQGSAPLVVTLCVLVALSEMRKWFRASKDVNRLEMLLLEYEDEADEDGDETDLPAD